MSLRLANAFGVASLQEGLRRASLVCSSPVTVRWVWSVWPMQRGGGDGVILGLGINGTATSSMHPFILNKAGCHYVRTLTQPCGDGRIVRRWGLCQRPAPTCQPCVPATWKVVLQPQASLQMTLQPRLASWLQPHEPSWAKTTLPSLSQTLDLQALWD